ncbi:hypothetical protein [Nitrosomonas sp. ANs5]|uniref:hypothetical protein n=1 Tax=Nitrosomonas sp. ANs5 TaxID=3423941 RepID=UPI003D32BF20
MIEPLQNREKLMSDIKAVLIAAVLVAVIFSMPMVQADTLYKNDGGAGEQQMESERELHKRARELGRDERKRWEEMNREKRQHRQQMLREEIKPRQEVDRY